LRDFILKQLNKALNLSYILDINSFSVKLNAYLELHNMNQADFSRASLISEATVSRLCRYRKNGSRRPIYRHDTIWSIVIIFNLNEADRQELFDLAFPQEAVLRILSETNCSLQEIDEILYELNLPTINKSNK